MKKLNSFFTIYLIISIVLGNLSLPALLHAQEVVVEENSAPEAEVLAENLSEETITTPETSPEETETIIPEPEVIQDEENSSVETEIVAETIVEPVAESPIEIAEIAAEPLGDYVDGEILVKYKENKIDLETVSGVAAATDISDANSLEKKEDITDENISVLTIEDNATVGEKITELEKDPNVEYAQPNFQYFAADISTDDTYRDLLWGLDNTGQDINLGTEEAPIIVTGANDADIDAPEAWAINEGGAVIVAVIDTGVDYTNQDLLANMWDGTGCVDENGADMSDDCIYGYDYGSDDNDPMTDGSSHGTHVSGIIGAEKNNNEGVVGVAPNAKIMALKTNLTTVEIIKAISFADQNGAKIINASWGSFGAGGANDQGLYDAIAGFSGLFIAAAGNGFFDGTDTFFNVDDGDPAHVFYPSGFTVDTAMGSGLNNIISVAATDMNDNLAGFSDYGATSVEVAAPGQYILSTVPGGYSFNSGTSMAAPHVAGLAALLWGYMPSLTNSEVKSSIINGGDSLCSLYNKTSSGKRINAFNTLSQITTPNHDCVAPVITLNGASPMNVTVGNTFTDPGATALDDIDLDITASIVVGGDVVDINTIGTYIITYNVSDAAHNPATEVTRTVNVVAAPSSGGGGGGGGGTSSTPKKKKVIPPPVVVPPITVPGVITPVNATPAIPAGCATTNNLFSPITGEKCPGVSGIVLGCTTGNLFSSLTGQPCPAALPAVTPAGGVLGAQSTQFTLLLQLGSHGPEVLALQNLLNNKGYDCGTADGAFGGKTKTCLIKFQIANGIPGLGIVGPMTRAALNK